MVHFTNPARLGPACGHHGVSTRDPSRVTCARCLTSTCYRTAADLDQFIDTQRQLHIHHTRTTA
jgi:hypothetical protein